MDEKLRIDKYLWAIRVYKTRTQAADAIASGKVKYAGNAVKASKPVVVGDKYEIKTEARKWIVEVTQPLHRRVSFEEAQKYYLDHTPENEKLPNQQAPAFYTGKRLSKIGRPTKKDRRNLENFTSYDDLEDNTDK